MAKAMGLISSNFADTLGNLTEQRSLSSLPFGGRYRLIDFALSNMANSGIKTVCMFTPFMYRSILDHVGAGKEWGLDRKNGGLLILPGAVFGMKTKQGKFLMRDFIQNKICLDRSNDEVVLLMSSNKIFNFDFSKVIDQHIKEDRDITMFYKSSDTCEDASGSFLSVAKDGTVTEIRNAKGTDNQFMDCMIIKRTLLIDIVDWYTAAAHVDLVDAISENLGKLKVSSYQFDQYVGNVENIVDYMKCNRDLFDEKVSRELFRDDQKIYTKSHDAPPTRYRSDAKVINSIVPAGCEIHGTVENSILFRGVKVGKGAVIKNSIILQRTVVGDNCTLEEVICDKGTVISAGAKYQGIPTNPCIITKT